MEKPYIVYAKTDDAGCIIAVHSSAFLSDAAGWTEVDSGFGDRYHHAQGNYLPGSIRDERGICRYKLTDGVIAERTQAEMDADWDLPEPTPTQLDIIEAQVTYTAMMTDTLLED